MKIVELTRGFVALVDDADYELVCQYSWRAIVNKKKCTVYAMTDILIEGKRKGVRMHRLILGITDPKVQVDHRDRDALNNQRGNLRICDNSQNGINRAKSRGVFTSQHKGVHCDKRNGKWRSQLWDKGVKFCLGSFVSELDAALAYDAAAREHFGEFAYCNFPPKLPCVASAPASMIAVGANIA